MKMPMLDQPKRRAETVSVFGGYDARDRRGTFPDRKYVSLSDMTDNGSIDAEKTSSSATICPCPLGEPDAVIIISAASPEASCDYWLDTSGGTDILRFRSGGEWQEVQAAGVRITVGGTIP